MKYILLFSLFAILNYGCVPGGASPSAVGGGNGTLSSLQFGNYKVLSVNMSGTDAGLLTGSTALRVTSNGSVTSLNFTVEDMTTGNVSVVPFGVQSFKHLATDYVAMLLSTNTVCLAKVSTGDIYQLSGVIIDELQMEGSNNLYALNKDAHVLSRIDLSAASLTSVNVNDPTQTASNSGQPANVFSSLNSPSSPFRFLSFNQIGSAATWLSPSYVFLGGGYIAAMGGPSAGPRTMIFKEGAAAYDCESSNLLSNVGGGLTGGAIQSSAGEIYQVQIVNSPNCSQPGIANCGDHLVKFGTSMAGMCGSTTSVVDFPAPSKFSSGATISYKTNYLLSDTTRYILSPNGFYMTSDDGNGGVTMNWVSVNLSMIPTDGTPSNPTVVLEGGNVYWLKNGTVYFMTLNVMGAAQVYYAGSGIQSFDIVQGHLFFVTAAGSFTVTNPGESAQPVASQLNLASTVKF